MASGSQIAPGATGKHRGSLWSIVVGASGVAIAAALVITTLTIPSAATQLSFSLDRSTPSITLGFPNCIVVTVHWHVITGGEANISVRSANEAIYVSDCNGPAPSNPTCPISYCGGASMGPGPVCFESGVSGSCLFTATQPQYAFGAFATPFDIGNLTVSFALSTSFFK